MDLFGTTCNFYIEKKPRYYTVYGGIFSILSLISFITFFFLLCQNDFERKIPTTTTSSIPSAGFRKIKFGEEKIWIPWRIMNYAQEYVNHTNIFYPIISYRHGIKIPGTTKTPLTSEILPYKLCNETEMINLDKNIFFIDNPIDEFYCIDMDDLYMGGGWGNDFIYFISMDLYLCKNGIEYDENNQNCTSYVKIKNLTGNNDSWAFEFLYPLVQFQPSNLKNPGIVVYKTGFFHFSQWTNKMNRLYLQEYVINDDLGWIKNNPKNFSFWGVSSISGDNYFNGNERDLMNEGSSSRIYSFKIYFDMGIIYSTRRYKKIYESLIDTLPILSILFSLFRSVTKIFKNASTNKKLTELIFENKVKVPSKFNNVARLPIIGQSPQIHTRTLGITKKNDYLKGNKDQPSGDLFVPNRILSGYMNHPIRDRFKRFNNSNINQSKIVNNISSGIKFGSINKNTKSKKLFPFKYYLYTVFLKNIDIKNQNKFFSKQYMHVYSYLCQLFDVVSYLNLHKQFGLLKKSLLSEQSLMYVESPNKININRKGFIRDINDCIKDNKLNLLPEG